MIFLAKLDKSFVAVNLDNVQRKVRLDTFSEAPKTAADQTESPIGPLVRYSEVI